MYNILLIEDDTALNKAISVYFKKEKFHVLSCFSGQELTPLEFKLLSFFLENQNQILLKETIIEKIWDSNENYVDEHTLLVNISRLRNKIEDDKHHYIKTVYGLGYRWCQDE